jgi:hypothetical protein
MFLASKAAWAGLVFILLTTGISGPRSTPLASGADLTKKPAVGHQNKIKHMQETLQKRTLPRQGCWRLRFTDSSQYSRVSESPEFASRRTG